MVVDAYAVLLDGSNRLTLTYHNLNLNNFRNFSGFVKESDIELLKLINDLKTDTIFRKLGNQKYRSTADFFMKIFTLKENEHLQKPILNLVERRMSAILPKLREKLFFISARDGNPAHMRIKFQEEPATIWFHFHKNSDGTHYYPTIKHGEQKIEIERGKTYIVCNSPLYLLINENLYTFTQTNADGKKILPFLKKKFINVPANVEEKYYSTFIANMIANTNVRAYGFQIHTEQLPLRALIRVQEFKTEIASLFDDVRHDSAPQIELELLFRYGQHVFSAANTNPVEVIFKNENGHYFFTKICRNIKLENEIKNSFAEKKYFLSNARQIFEKSRFPAFIRDCSQIFAEYDVEITQNQSERKFFAGKSSLRFEVNQTGDWFDIQSFIYFGEYKFPLVEIRALILAGKEEILLPNGETAFIPKEWFDRFSLFLSYTETEADKVRLPAHYLGLVQELHKNHGEQFGISEKIKSLSDFENISDYAVPKKFKAELRPYQKAGYQWLKFLQEYNFGGILADDMGLGKTVQALALLCEASERGKQTSLLIVPTSLTENWHREILKFAPHLNVLLHTGAERRKIVTHFPSYDLIITTYGTFRSDAEILCGFYYHYVILDEAHYIKNPAALITKSLEGLQCKHRIAITGTPVENSALDLWTQMNFVNRGLLGTQNYFKNEFQNPIEKKNDFAKQEKLAALIKPFILRRTKEQVAKDLPPKTEYIQYCEMTDEQAALYERVKNEYRNTILDQIEREGFAKSQFLLLRGLTLLRQIANHPKMTDENSAMSSGKFEEIFDRLEVVLANGNKVLVFSQFVKHLTLIKEALVEKNIGFCYIDGSTKKRIEQVEQFQNDPKIQVFLISLKAGGVGLNLTAADYVFVLDPWWNPAAEAQAIDRAHRIGQNKNVFVYKFISRETVEEKILRIQERKKQLSEDLISAESSFMKSLTQDDIKELFM